MKPVNNSPDLGSLKTSNDETLKTQTEINRLTNKFNIDMALLQASKAASDKITGR